MNDVAMEIFSLRVKSIQVATRRGRAGNRIHYSPVACAALHAPYGSAFHTNLDVGTSRAAMAGRIT
jgi:hypothetical protein